MVQMMKGWDMKLDEGLCKDTLVSCLRNERACIYLCAPDEAIDPFGGHIADSLKFIEKKGR